MNVNFAKLSRDGLHITLMAISGFAGSMAASKALGEINAARRAAPEEPSIEGENLSIDPFTAFAETLEDHETEHDPNSVTPERPVGFVEWCALLAATNDEIASLAGRTGWPIPQTPGNILDFKIRQTQAQAAKDEDVQGLRALMEAYKPGSSAGLKDEQLKETLLNESKIRSERFSSMFRANRQEIIERLVTGMTAYNRFSESTWLTCFNNLPDRNKYRILGTIDTRMAGKVEQLITGRNRDGSPNKGAQRSIMNRAADVGLIRHDQLVIRHERTLLAAAVSR